MDLSQEILVISLAVGGIDVIYIIWTDNGRTFPEANTQRQEGKYPMIKALQGCILKLLLYLVNSVLILYRTMQSAILLSFVASSSLPPCRLQSTHPPMSSYISPYAVYKVWSEDPRVLTNKMVLTCGMEMYGESSLGN